MMRVDWLGGLRSSLRRAPRRRVRRTKRRQLSVRNATFEVLEDRRLLATLTVNSPLDNVTAGDGLVTLREAIIAANINSATDLGETGSGADTIAFDAAVFATSHTTLLTLGEMQITEAVTIDGPGRDLLTINAHLQSRIFSIIAPPGKFMISGLALTGGKVSENGAAIYASGAEELTVSHCTITGNTAVFQGSAISAHGTLSVVDSIVSGNSVVNGGPAIYGRSVILTDSTVGGGINCGGYISVTDATITDGGMRGQFVTVSNSTVSGQIQVQLLGGHFDYGSVTLTNTIASGGIDADRSSITLSKSTINNGGIITRGEEFGDVTLIDSAINGGGILAPDTNYDLSIILINSMVSNGSGIGISYGTISLNSSTLSGGGGIIVSQHGSVQLTNSSVSDNGGDGIRAFRAVISIDSSTISGNSGVGISAGTNEFPANVNLTNSTVSGNARGGIEGGFYSGSIGVTLTNSTVSGNGHGAGQLSVGFVAPV